MINFSITKRIAAPVDAVFDVASDIAHAAEHVRGIVKIELLTPGPVGVGTKWLETRRMMGRESTVTLEFTKLDRPHHYTVGCNSCGAYIETTFRFTPIGAAGGPVATDLTIDVRCEPRSLYAKLLWPLTRLVFEKAMCGCLEGDLEDIRRVAESRATNVVSAPDPLRAESAGR